MEGTIEQLEQKADAAIVSAVTEDSKAAAIQHVKTFGEISFRIDAGRLCTVATLGVYAKSKKEDDHAVEFLNILGHPAGNELASILREMSTHKDILIRAFDGPFSVSLTSSLNLPHCMNRLVIKPKGLRP